MQKYGKMKINFKIHFLRMKMGAIIDHQSKKFWLFLFFSIMPFFT